MIRVVCVCIGCLLALPAFGQNALDGVGDLAGGINSSQAEAISANGTVVVGRSTGTNGGEAFRWTDAGGIVGLGDLAGGSFFSVANGVNSDGTVIVGQATSGSGTEAFRWTQAGGMVSIGDLAGGLVFSIANDVNSDGTVIVGRSNTAAGPEAFRWTQAGGMVGLGDLTGGTDLSSASGVSDDGTVVVGSGNSASGSEAFRWTQAGGMVGLGDLAGGSFDSEASAVNADGTVIVGTGRSASGPEAFRWTQAGGMVGLGDLTGGSFNSAAIAVSADGNTIVGESRSSAAISDGSPTGSEAFIWTAADGMVAVKDWLTNAGVTVTNFDVLYEANDVSADGTIVVGTGINSSGDTEGYLARVSSVGSGIFDPVSTAQSVDALQGVEAMDLRKTLMVLHGAHHRPLMQMHPDAKQGCAWINADIANLDYDTDGFASNQEVGGCQALLGSKLYIGAGVGLHQARQDAVFNGKQKLKGQYVVAEVNYAPVKTLPLQLAVTGLYRQTRATLRRGYLNAGSTDQSTGKTDINTMALRSAIHLPGLVKIQNVRLSPRISHTVSTSRIGGYTETGGGFPIAVNSRRHTIHQMRAGLDIGYVVSPQTTIRSLNEVVRQFGSSTGNVSGDIIGLSGFSQSAGQQARTWGRFGLEVQHAFNNHIGLLVSTFASTTEGYDADLSGAVRLNVTY